MSEFPSIGDPGQGRTIHAANLDNRQGTTLKERHPSWPEIEPITIFFSAHGDPSDLADMEQEFNQSHIYFYEHTSGNQGVPFLQRIAKTPRNPFNDIWMDLTINTYTIGGELIKGSIFESIFRNLYGSNKIVGHFDLREEDRDLNQQIKKNLEKNIIAPSLDETLKNYQEKEVKDIALQTERERGMPARFEGELERIFTEYPQLKRQPQVKAIATLGSSHEGVVSTFRAAGIPTEAVFSNSHTNNDFYSQVRKTLSRGDEPSKDLLAKAYLEGIFLQGVRRTLEGQQINSDVLITYASALADHFTIPEIEVFHTERIQGLTIRKIDDLLQRKGISPLPRSADAIDKLIY